MAVNLNPPASLEDVPGIRIGVAAGELRYKQRDDVCLLEFPAEASVACTFTNNRFCAAPVTVARSHLSKPGVRFALINAGNANAGTGSRGMDAANRTCEIVGQLGSVSPEAVLPFSTGVIGEQLPLPQFESAIRAAFDDLGQSSWNSAAAAIMTTDTVPKGLTRQFTLDDRVITVTGIAKGSGMICPDMATMLAFVTTDAKVSSHHLQALLSDLVDQSFNAITVDGDTSTNDACLLVASGESQTAFEPGRLGWDELVNALSEVFLTLAQAIVRDGEGAEKFIGIHVTGAKTRDDARAIAYTVGHSPLFKTAANASDPNWGRILAAVGRAPISELSIDRVNLKLDDVYLIRSGEPDPDYREEEGKRVMSQPEFNVSIELDEGDASASVWTSDLSHEYVRINAEYRS